MKKSSRNYTLCEVTTSPVRRYGKTSKALKPFPITAQRFAAARAGCFLTIEQTAKLLRVSIRTLHNWENGRVRIPYAAYKLIRILRGYELPGDSWKGYRLVGDTLWSPENLPFHAADARWWSLTVQMAHEYRRQSKARQAQRTAENGAPAKVENVREASLGLVNPAERSQPKSSISPLESKFELVPSANRGLKSLYWGHNGATLSYDSFQDQRKIQSQASACPATDLPSTSGIDGNFPQCLLFDGVGGIPSSGFDIAVDFSCSGKNFTACADSESGQERFVSMWERSKVQGLPRLALAFRPFMAGRSQGGVL